MGHDHHFLSRLDRVQADHLELALGLYRDHELIHSILRHAGAPAEADRIAISLADPERGPFVIVGRNGRFVTCLGEGMVVNSAPVVTRDRLDVIAQHETRLRDMMRVGTSVAPAGQLGELLLRPLDAGDDLSREEISGLLSVSPLLAAPMFRMFLDTIEPALKMLHRVLAIHKFGPMHEEMIHTFWRATWGGAHAALLCGFELPPGYPDPLHPTEGEEPLMYMSSLALQTGVSYCALRAFRTSALRGERLFGYYQDLFETSEEKTPLLNGVFGLVGIGVRHPRLRDQAWGVLRQGAGAKGRAAGIWGEHYDHIRNVIEEVFENPEGAIVPLDEAMRRRLYQIGRSMPYGSPFKFMRELEVPTEMCRAFMAAAMTPLLATVGDIMDQVRLISWAVRAAPEDLYLSWELRRAMRDYWSLEKGRALVKAVQGSFQRSPEGPPRLEKEPGPNQPCSCGSGKKFKKCCWRKRIEG